MVRTNLSQACLASGGRFSYVLPLLRVAPLPPDGVATAAAPSRLGLMPNFSGNLFDVCRAVSASKADSVIPGFSFCKFPYTSMAYAAKTLSRVNHGFLLIQS